jgi:glycosyltransferase involved in cell wall biosynthesis
MKFSILIPSYNQARYIEATLRNVSALKATAGLQGIEVEVILVDNCSDAAVQSILAQFKDLFDHLDISKDKGQYDAINKGLIKASGAYWTWLNTDDCIDLDGFLQMVEVLKSNPEIDYIYGSIAIVNEADKLIRVAQAYPLSLNGLLHKRPSVFQPGSFFKKSFTDKIGPLQNNRACFDYEYILRLLSNKALFYHCDWVLARFRLYPESKSGSIKAVFLKEQLRISKTYGRNFFSFMTFFLNLRLLKQNLMNLLK